jgi:chitin disaccharide deacetylase
MNGSAPRRIWLCADDYGISPGVNRAIRDLVERGRINATSAMVVGPALGRAEAGALCSAAANGPGCAIGLHVTLTAPFRPLTMHFHPTNGGMFVGFPRLLRAGLLRRLDPEIVHGEIMVQFEAFADLFGRAPDFVDGHQHAQLFPQITEAFLAAVKTAAPDAWVRQCGHEPPMRRPSSPKALLLDLLSTQFRRRARRAGIRFNPGFAGAYDFSRQPDFGALMAGFLDGLPQDAVVMCHPGIVDETLVSVDPFTAQREREYAYLGSEAFPRLLSANNFTLA